MLMSSSFCGTIRSTTRWRSFVPGRNTIVFVTLKRVCASAMCIMMLCSVMPPGKNDWTSLGYHPRYTKTSM